MNMKRIILAGCSIVILSVGTAMAGPCDTSGRAANLKDAGPDRHRPVPGQTQPAWPPTPKNIRRRAR